MVEAESQIQKSLDGHVTLPVYGLPYVGQGMRLYEKHDSSKCRITITNANGTAITGAKKINAWSSINGATNTMIWTNGTIG